MLHAACGSATLCASRKGRLRGLRAEDEGGPKVQQNVEESSPLSWRGSSGAVHGALMLQVLLRIAELSWGGTLCVCPLSWHLELDRNALHNLRQCVQRCCLLNHPCTAPLTTASRTAFLSPMVLPMEHFHICLHQKMQGICSIMAHPGPHHPVTSLHRPSPALLTPLPLTPVFFCLLFFLSVTFGCFCSAPRRHREWAQLPLL